MGASLTSDHVNYLIWRYLQEHGYGKAAIQLSRDWGNDDPHALPFVDSIKPYFLIQMLQDGLAYDRLVSAVRQSQAKSTPPPQEGSPARSPPDQYGRRYGFVDVRVRRASKRPEEMSAAMASESDARRKRPRTDANGLPDGATARRRKSKSLGGIVQTNGEAMDVDTDETPRGGSVEETALEIPVKEEPPPLICTLDIGDSRGMQSDPVVDKTIAKTLAALKLPNTDVTALAWDEQVQDRLQVSGGYSFHNLAMQTRDPGGTTIETTDEQLEYELLPSHLLDAEAGSLKWYYVPAVALADKGSKLAFMVESVDENEEPDRSILLRAGGSTKLLARPSNTVISLDFNPSATHVLALWPSPSSPTSNLSIFSVAATSKEEADPDQADSSLPQDPICKTVFPTEIFAAAFIDSSTFVVAGDAILSVLALQHSEGPVKMSLLKSIETEHTWEHMAHDSHSKQIALISSSSPGTIGLLSYPSTSQSADNTPEYSLITKEAHDDGINAIAWQPLSPASNTAAITTPANPSEEPPNTADQDAANPPPDQDTAAPAIPTNEQSRLLATACTDGTVVLWRARGALERFRTFTLGAMVPAVALAFSPDGKLVAAASEHLVLVWNVDHDSDADSTDPVAHWEEPAASSPDTAPEPMPALAADELRERDADGDAAMATAGVEDAASEAGEVGQGECYNLAWDAQGKRLAFARGEKVTVIGMPS